MEGLETSKTTEVVIDHLVSTCMLEPMEDLRSSRNSILVAFSFRAWESWDRILRYTPFNNVIWNLRNCHFEVLEVHIQKGSPDGHKVQAQAHAIAGLSTVLREAFTVGGQRTIALYFKYDVLNCTELACERQCKDARIGPKLIELEWSRLRILVDCKGVLVQNSGENEELGEHWRGPVSGCFSLSSYSFGHTPCTII